MQTRENKSITDTVHITDVNGIRTAVVMTDIDRYSADRILHILQDAAVGRSEFILSLQCDFCDSYGLAMIIALSRQIGDRCFIIANDRVLRIIEIAGLDKVLNMSRTIADAVDALVSAP